jgi:L-Ala-D/L-Glu epimerase
LTDKLSSAFSAAALPGLTSVEAIHVRVPFRRPLLDASGEYTHRRSWLLRIVDADGNEGLGEATLSPIAADIAAGSLAGLIREIATSLAAGRIPAWAELAAEGEPGRAAMAGMDGAIGALMAARGAWSDAATAAGSRMAAPAAAPIPVGAVIAFGGPDAGADAAAQAVELGFETLKLRAGFERTTEQLVDRLRAIRAAVGPGPRLRVDVAGAWDLEIASERIAAIAPFRIEYVEQPLPAWDVAGHAALRERVRVPIALDESIDSEGSARAALAEGAADVIVVKPARVGGMAATMRVLEAAAGRASVVLGTYYETGVGIAAVLRIAATMRQATASGAGRAGHGAAERSPMRTADGRDSGRMVPRAVEEAGFEPAHGLATAGILVHDLLAVPLPIEKGRMAVPATVRLDRTEVDRYTLERFEEHR